MKPTTTTDPIVAQVRNARDSHAAQYDYDIRAIFKAVQEQQSSTGRKYVRYPARPSTPQNKNGITNG